MTTADYLESLQQDLTTIKANLADGGMEISESDNFSNLATKTTGIQIGGGGYTGHYDAEGLAQINWTNNDIQYYQDNAVLWNSEQDSDYELTTYEIQSSVGKHTRFMPKTTTLTTFRDYANLMALPYLNINKQDWSNTFRGCSSLITIPLLDTSNATTMATMFTSCASLIKIPLLNTGNVETMTSFLQGCSNLKEVPLLNTSKVTNAQNMFNGCVSLRSIPLFDTSKITNMNNMFQNCYSLTTIPILDTSSVVSMSATFGYCYCLSDNSLNNILRMCINANSFTGTKTLTTLGFNATNYPASRIQALPHYQDFINAGWTIGY